MSANLEEESGFFVCFGFISQDGNGAIGMETVDHAGPGRESDAEPLETNGHAAVGADFQVCARTPDVGPPRATRGWTQVVAIFSVSLAGGRVRSAGEFAVDFQGVTVATQCGQECVGPFG